MSELSDADRLSDVAEVVQTIKETDNVAVVREYKTKTEGPEHTELKVTLSVEHDAEGPEDVGSWITEDPGERIKTVKSLVAELESDNGVPIGDVIQAAVSEGMDEESARHEIEKLRKQGDVYEPVAGYIRTV